MHMLIVSFYDTVTHIVIANRADELEFEIIAKKSKISSKLL